MDDIIKLIDLSLEDGRLSPDDYRIILKKAVAQGISEEEFNLILSKRSKQTETSKGSHDFDTRSKLPYVFAALAVVFTFFDWFGAYSRSTVMGSSGSWDYTFTAWWGGYGATVVLIYAVGCYFYFKSNRFYWLAGLLAVADALYIYSAISSADVSVSYNYEGYGGSLEAGYKLLWGFWLFLIASGLFTTNGLLLSYNLSPEQGVVNRYKSNFRAGKKVLGRTIIVSSIIHIIFMITVDSFAEAIFAGILISLLFTLITLFVYMFSSSSRSTGYIILGIGLLLFGGVWFLAGERAEFLKLFILLVSFPLSYVLLERKTSSRSAPLTSTGNIGVLILFITLMSGCSDQPNRDNGIVTSNNINGTYTNESGGIESTITVIGDYWYGTHTEMSFGNLISSGSGSIDGKRIYDEYGVELGYISNGTAYVNIGGMEVSLQKE